MQKDWLELIDNYKTEKAKKYWSEDLEQLWKWQDDQFQASSLIADVSKHIQNIQMQVWPQAMEKEALCDWIIFFSLLPSAGPSKG